LRGAQIDSAFAIEPSQVMCPQGRGRSLSSSGSRRPGIRQLSSQTDISRSVVTGAASIATLFRLSSGPAA
jgi:hypothetical protein